MEKLKKVSPHSLEGDTGWQLRDAYKDAFDEFERYDIFNALAHNSVAWNKIVCTVVHHLILFLHLDESQ